MILVSRSDDGVHEHRVGFVFRIESTFKRTVPSLRRILRNKIVTDKRKNLTLQHKNNTYSMC